ncbi:MAG: serine/threonine-protein kinase [Cyanobacteria bacterium P01_H01_bin.26]
MADSNLGRKLVNRYKLTKSIGQGSMGTVYLAEDTLLGGVPVAVKLLSQALLNDRMTERFLTEAKTSALLGQKCIHVVRVIDQKLTAEGQPFYVMEYLKGKNLDQVIRPRPLGIPRFLDLTRQICLGLKAAHEGILIEKEVVSIIHRDIKPSNILVLQSPEFGELVKVLDFGIAKLLQADTAKQTTTFMGTLAYSSPEQMDGQVLDSRSDIYSLGLMMYQMLTGSLPYWPSKNNFGGWYKAHTSYDAIPLKDAVSRGKVPSLLNDVVMSCLAKDRTQRPASVDKILSALASIRDSEQSLPALPEPPVGEPESEEDQFCREQTWPVEKPIAKIVFPQLLVKNKQKLPTLWVMLSPQEIEHRANNTRYNTFLCTLNPHPMLLWVTAFYSNVQGPRWLSSYLDLKNKSHQKLAWQLGEDGYYRVLLFSEQAPNQVLTICKFNIAQTQCNILREWIMQARTTMAVGSPQDSKALLKRELDQNLKPRGFW